MLLLDEPVAALDPLARRHFLAALAEAVADGDLTVIISSHLIGDLERICDHLVLLAAARAQLCGNISELVAAHKLLTGPRRNVTGIAGVDAVIEATHTPRQTTLLVRTCGDVRDPAWDVTDVSLEDVVLAYMSQDAPISSRTLHPVGGDR